MQDVNRSVLNHRVYLNRVYMLTLTLKVLLCFTDFTVLFGLFFG